MSQYTLATLYGIGLVRKAPGTAGSLVAAAMAYAMLSLPHGTSLLAVGVILSTILGSRTATLYMAQQKSDHDPKEIVIDEVAGQWLTYALCQLCLMLRGMPFALSPTLIAFGFILFRIFDILKPWPISVADARVKGGFGVMFDDLLAAIPAALILFLCAAWLG